MSVRVLFLPGVIRIDELVGIMPARYGVGGAYHFRLELTDKARSCCSMCLGVALLRYRIGLLVRVPIFCRV